MAKITFIQHDGKEQTVEGTPGMSVMETAVKNMVPGIDADCGGACACATCHVWVGKEWAGKLVQPTDEESEMLDGAFQVDERSRLCCQIIMTPELDGLEVELAPESLADDADIPVAVGSSG